MKRMVTDEEIIGLIQKYAPGFDPSSIEEGDILQTAVLGLNEDGDAVKGDLFGKYVRIIDYTGDGTNLSDDMLAAIEKGVFINGAFSYLVNPIFIPRTDVNFGVCFGTRSDNNRCGLFPYTISGKNITVNVNRGVALTNQAVWINGNDLRIQDFVLPHPPSDRTHAWVFIIDTDGTGKWVDPSTL